MLKGQKRSYFDSFIHLKSQQGSCKYLCKTSISQAVLLQRAGNHGLLAFPNNFVLTKAYSNHPFATLRWKSCTSLRLPMNLCRARWHFKGQFAADERPVLGLFCRSQGTFKYSHINKGTLSSVLELIIQKEKKKKKPKCIFFSTTCC